jgi:photosystem II stability/assembly factor-like uncharacterized protein
MQFAKFLKKVAILTVVALLCASCRNLPELGYNPWEVVPVASDAKLFDIDFVDNSDHGWIVGSAGTLLETRDGGKTWETQQIDLGEENILLTSVSFKGSEGWIVGEPSVLLHTTDEGRSWNRIALSDKLPGAPNNIVALGPDSAEMTTNVGAIYQTRDGGKTWKALVEEAVGVIRSLSRSQDGQYITVSAKGNFYSTWEPEQSAWTPHNRYSSKRLEKIGFGKDDRLWMLARGGEIRFGDPQDPETWGEPLKPQFSSSWGLLDLAYRTPEEIWVSGGGGNLLCSFDGGKTWQKDRAVEDVPSNFYHIEFMGPERGFILGQRGTLLRYAGTPSEAA